MQQLFKTGFSAVDIAEPLLVFEADARATEVHGLLEAGQTDVAGILIQGYVDGFVLRQELLDGCCLDHLHSFKPGAILPQSASYQEVIETLDRTGHCFVTYDWNAIVEMSSRLDRMLSRL